MEQGECPFPFFTLFRLVDLFGSSLTELFALVEILHEGRPGESSSLELWDALKSYVQEGAIKCRSSRLYHVLNQYGLVLLQGQQSEIAQLDVPIAELGEDFTCAWANDMGLELWGDNILGSQVHDYKMTEEESQAVYKRLSGVLEGKIPLYCSNAVAKFPDGRVHGVGSVGAPKRDRFGRVHGVTIVVLDMTRELKAEVDAFKALQSLSKPGSFVSSAS
jgi:PAS domain-containing protein